MTHRTEVVEVKEVSDEQVAYRVRCCGEEQTDSWHTVSVTAENHDEELMNHMQRVQELHHKKEAWRRKIATKSSL